MEFKRTVLAITLSFVVVMGWSYLSVYMGWVPEPVPIEQQQAQRAALEAQQNAIVVQEAAPVEQLPQFKAVEGRDIIIDTPLYTATFYSGGGVIKSFQLKDYKDSIATNSPKIEMFSEKAAQLMPFGLLINGQPSWSLGQWSYDGGDVSLQDGEQATITIQSELEGVRLIRELTFFADTYLIDEKIKIGSLDTTNRNTRLSYTLSASSFIQDSSNYDVMRIGLMDSKNSLETIQSDKELNSTGLSLQGKYGFASLMNNYFMVAVLPNPDSNYIFKGRIQNDVWRIALENNELVAPANNNALLEVGNSWWIGPKDRQLMKTAPNNLAKSVDLGMFSFLAIPMLWLLGYIYDFVQNWGIAIVLLTFVIRLLMLPLTRSSFKSMENMKKVQPMMKQLQDKYKDDKEKLNMEMMQLYKTYKVNPLGGCLPILFQMPVFFALYQALLNALELRHATFIPYLPFTDIVWLADLSTKDPLYITPILMGLTMFIQQKMSPAVGDPTQQKVMLFMPIIFTAMFLGFPSGLVIYWLCSNIFSIAQQWYTLRKA